MINFPYIGSYIVQVDLYIVDDLEIVWHHLDCKNHISVKVEEDPVRQKLFAALAASNAASVASSTNMNNPTTQISAPVVTPNGTSVPSMYMQRTNNSLETKMETT